MALPLLDPNDILGYDCRHATYVPNNELHSDILFVKEYVHTKDGKRYPNTRIIQDKPINFWVTKKGHQNHKDKKEWELESKLQKFTTTRVKLLDAIPKALERPGLKGSLRMLAQSPYLYGCDIHPSALLKHEYQTKYPDCIHPTASVAVMDIETDVIWGTGEIILVTLSFKDKIFTAINQRFVEKIGLVEQKVQDAFVKYLAEYKLKRNITLTTEICNSPGECAKRAIEKAHEWQPDFVTFWNINFDVPKMCSQMESEGIDLARVWSDPTVPEPFKYFNYKEGPSQKITQGGKVIPLMPAERWHIAICPASFYLVDSMCLFKRLRIAKGNESSYSLDHILNKYLGIRKLNFQEVDHIENKLEWHQVMQRQYKIEYIIYNIFDCISVEVLDETVGDVGSSFTTLCEISDFSNFTSNPRRLVDDLHFTCREEGLVIATTSNDMREEVFDNLTVGLNNWIITLDSNNMNPLEGITPFKELPDLRSQMFTHNWD